MTDRIPRYRITVDVYAFEINDRDLARLETLIGSFFGALFPLGVVEHYPDIQAIAADSPFVAS